MFSRFTHPCSICQYFNPFYGRIVFYCMDIPHFVYPFVDGHWGCFCFLTVINSAAVNTCVQIFEWTYVFNSFEWNSYSISVPRSGIADSCSHFIFNLLSNSNFLPKWLHSFTFLLAVCECPNCSMFSPTLVICICNYSDSYRYGIVAHWQYLADNIHWVDWFHYHYKLSFLSLVTVFIFKSILLLV